MNIVVISKFGSKTYENVSDFQILTSNGWINILPNHRDLVTDFCDESFKMNGKTISLDFNSGILRVYKNNISLISR